MPLAAQADVWKAGVARVNITPAELMWMSGYGGRDKPAEGKLHDLWAKALVLQDAEGARVVLVTMDLVGIDRELAGRVCRQLQEKHRLDRAAIALAVSHTHTGPVIGENLRSMYFLDDQQQRQVAQYTADLEKKLLAVVDEAAGRLAPARVEWGRSRATFAVNRRNNPEPEVPRLRAAGELKGPVDHDLPVLAVRDAQGDIKAIVCGYACHATTLDFYRWSGDWPGFAQIELEKSHPGAVVMFWAGCGADQNPLPRRTVERAEQYGKQLAAGADAALAAPMQAISGRLKTSYREIDLPLAQLPSREQLLSDATAGNRFVARRAKLLLAAIQRDGKLNPSYPYPVQVWRLGPDLKFILLGGEVVVDYSLRLKQELGEKTTWVAGYSNDVMAYIPSRRVLTEGGYEGGGAMVYYGLPSAWAPQVEELIVGEVHRQVDEP